MKGLPTIIIAIVLIVMSLALGLGLSLGSSPPWATQEAYNASMMNDAAIKRNESEAKIESERRQQDADLAFQETLLNVVRVGGIGIALGLALAGLGVGVGVAGKAWQWSVTQYPNKRGQGPIVITKGADGQIAIADTNKSLTGLTVIDQKTLALTVAQVVRKELAALPSSQSSGIRVMGPRDDLQLAATAQANHVAATAASVSNRPDEPLIKTVVNRVNVTKPRQLEDPYTINKPGDVVDAEPVIPPLPPIKIKDETGTHILEAK